MYWRTARTIDLCDFFTASEGGHYVRSSQVPFPRIIRARIATRRLAVPRRVMRPGPSLLDCPARHRLKCPRRGGGSLVHVNDEARQHHERREIVQHVREGRPPAPERLP